MVEISRDNRIKDLFHEALELDEDARTALLERASSADPAIVVEVRILIGAHARAQHFLCESDSPDRAAPELFPTAPLLPSGEAIGDRIGRYELLEVIGEGGFGRVYRARQQEPVVRDVALKVIKAGMDSQQVIARFEAERQALALMAHPAIATVFDAGTTATGRPYFVMELVEGVPVTDYCDAHRQTIEQRIDLFRQVCAAVQHAHTKGVIHRDLKPSNVLVTLRDGQPQPKVIDFGIAKATTARLTEKALFTESRQLVGTPEYMSPEQADVNAADIDTRSDVYALGVLLYELLTGATPFDGVRLRSAAFGELQRIIREEDPPKPSTRLSTLDALPSVAAQRGIEPRQLTSNLRGDLDWITLRALEKSRERRYGSAAELAEDLRRHLNHEAVLAGPPAKGYRLRKFVRRNRLLVAAVTAVATAVVGGAVVATVGMLKARASAVRERQAAQEAISINDFMRGVLTSVDPDRDGADVRLLAVLQSASENAGVQFADHPQLEAQVRQMLGDVYGHLSIWKDAAREAQRAHSLWLSAAGEDDVRTLGAQLQLAITLLHVRDLGAIDKVLADLSPRVLRVLGPDHELTIQVERTAGTRIATANFREGALALRATYDHARRVHAREEVQIACLNAYVEALESFADTDQADASALADLEFFARDLAERAAAQLGPAARRTITARLSLAQAAYARGNYSAVADECDEILQQTLNRFSDCHNIRAATQELLAQALYRLDRKTEAADMSLHATECARGRDLLTFSSRIEYSLPLLEQGGQWARGEALSRELKELLSSMGGHAEAADWTDADIASFVSRQGRLDEADALFAPMLARRDEAHPGVLARLERQYGEHLMRKGMLEKAQRHLLLAAEIVGDVRLGTWPEVPDDIICAFIDLYDAWGMPDKAAEYRRLQQESLDAPMERFLQP